MSLEVLLSLAIKDIGVLTERVNSLEVCLLNATMKDEEDYDDHESYNLHEHRFTFPIAGKTDEDSILNTSQCRYLKSSMYNVQIFKPYSEEVDSPLMINVEMTRDELDDFIAKNPGKNYREFIVSVKPALEEYL